MKKALLGLLSIILFVVVVIGLLILMKKPAPPATNTGTSFPIASSTTGGQQTVSTNSFLNNKAVAPDTDNPGYYYVGYHPSGADATNDPPYLIEYIDQTKYFNITILHEPIGETRVAAETYLTNTLGLTQEQMCSLNYTVYVPNSVSSSYSGTNLGFSFCPSAVPLPQ